MGIDDLGIRKTDCNVISRRSIFLEVRWPSYLNEGIMGFLSIQSIRLEPLFSSADSVRSRSRYNPISAWHHVGNQRLPGEWRQCFAIRFVSGTCNDGARDALLFWIRASLLRDWTGI